MQPFANLNKRLRGTSVYHKFDLTRKRAQRLYNEEKDREEPNIGLLGRLRAFLGIGAIEKGESQ